MYIYPNTEIKILHNVPLNNSYDHTIYFSRLQDQTDFFTSYSRVKYSLSNNQYQRKERGWIQVQLNQNQLWDCTYMMFKNTNYTIANSNPQQMGTSLKWFYAFITSVEYVNESVSKIKFEIDVIQTWHFQYTLDKCFVEREHSETDNLYEHIVEEDLDTGEIYHVQANNRYNLDCTRLAIVELGDWQETSGGDGHYEPYKGSFLGRYYTGARYVSYDLLNENQDYDILTNHLKNMIKNGVEDAIVAIYQYPRFMGSIPTNQGEYDPTYGYVETNYTFYPNTVQLDGYIPRNKKLFTYPYDFIEIDNGVGDTNTLKLEMWNSGHVGEFKIFGTPLGMPTCACMPVYYNGEANSYQNALTLKIDIQCAWSGDAYQVWLARNEKNMKMRKIGAGYEIAVGLGGLAAGTIMENPAIAREGGAMLVQGGRALVDTIFDKIRKKNITDATPDPVHGQISNDLLNLQSNLNHYAFRQKTIKQEYAKIIDEYFSRFGYACKRIKVPNRNARQNWSYVKTDGCEITGNIPSDDVVKLKNIYDNGITFWNDGTKIGNYDDNEYGAFYNPVYSS